MKSLSEIIEFLKTNTHTAPESIELCASQILDLDKKTRKDVLYILEHGGCNNIEHLSELSRSCRGNKINIEKVTESQIISYCNNEVSAEEIITAIHKRDLERLVPNYHEPPCKIKPKAAERLKRK